MCGLEEPESVTLHRGSREHVTPIWESNPHFWQPLFGVISKTLGAMFCIYNFPKCGPSVLYSAGCRTFTTPAYAERGNFEQ